jgi:hypothetical protein
MVDVSLGVEGVVCEEQEGHVSVYSALYCILQGPRVSPPRFLTPWSLENSQALLRTPASAYIPVVAFPSLSCRLKKSGKASKKVKERTIGRTSLAIRYSRCLERSRNQSPRVSMPWVRVL